IGNRRTKPTTSRSRRYSSRNCTSRKASMAQSLAVDRGRGGAMPGRVEAERPSAAFASTQAGRQRWPKQPRNVNSLDRQDGVGLTAVGLPLAVGPSPVGAGVIGGAFQVEQGLLA